MNVLASDTFKKRLQFLKKSEFWSTQQLRDYQDTQFRELMGYVYHRVPYYTECMNSLGLTPEDFQSIADIAKMPLLTKAMIQESSERFVPDGVDPAKLYNRSTGGSTGSPLTVRMDAEHLARDKANTEFYVSVAGLSIFAGRSVRLYGDRIPEEILAQGEYWYVADERKLVMSCFHVNHDTVTSYVRAVDNFRPDYIHSRPSSIFPLARAMEERGMSMESDLKAVFLDGEYLPPTQRSLLERVFGCRVYLVFGHTEGCAVGMSCPESRMLHFMPQVGVFELLRPDGTACDKEGETGEMVVTGFNNRVFPLIRYRTMDVAVNTLESCSCGRNYRMVKSVEGRMQDYAIAKDGSSVPVAPALFNYNDMNWEGVRQFQAEQTQRGELLIRIAREPDFNETPEAMKSRILRDVNSILGGQFSLEIQYVDKIPRTEIGKFRYFLQKMNLSPMPVGNGGADSL